MQTTSLNQVIKKALAMAIAIGMACYPARISAQKILDKVQKTVNKATGVLYSTALLANAARRTTEEFSKTVKVIKGNNERPAHIPAGKVTKPKYKKGEFTNINWEPVTYFDGQLFPSTIIGLATYKGKLEGEMEAISRPVGFRMISSNQYIPLKWEIECSDANYFENVSGSLFYENAKAEIYLMPEIPWRYDVLARQIPSAPLTLIFRLYDEEGNKEEKIVPVLMRSVNDCMFRYKELDMSFLFTAFVQEEHPEIDIILKEALNTKMIKAISGYQEGKEKTLMQIAAIWRVLHDRGFQYSSITETVGTTTNITSQTVRTFDNAIKTQQANCIDGTIVLASILRKIGISPVMVLVPRHCFLGFYPDATRKTLIYVETVMLSESEGLDKATTAESKTNAYLALFKAAMERGMKVFKEYDATSIKLIDIDLYRQLVKPIPF